VKGPVEITKSAQLALDGGEPVRTEFLPLTRPWIGEEEKREVMDTLVGYRFESSPNAAWLSNRILSLPLFPQMTENDVQDVARAVRKVIACTHLELKCHT
jgi:dTDP-4-amino-4,6-dideoxygalactose transaminase